MSAVLDRLREALRQRGYLRDDEADELFAEVDRLRSEAAALADRWAHRSDAYLDGDAEIEVGRCADELRALLEGGK